MQPNGSKFMTVSMIAMITWLLLVVSTQATTRTWTGAGAGALASTDENWSDNTAPATGDSVMFDPRIRRIATGISTLNLPTGPRRSITAAR